MVKIRVPIEEGHRFKCGSCSKFFKVVGNGKHEEIDRIEAENLTETPKHPSETCNNCVRNAEDKGHLDLPDHLLP